mgnify:FL=1
MSRASTTLAAKLFKKLNYFQHIPPNTQYFLTWRRLMAWWFFLGLAILLAIVFSSADPNKEPEHLTDDDRLAWQTKQKIRQ